MDGDAPPAAEQDQLDDADLQPSGHLRSACGIWVVSAIIALVPLAIIAEVSYPHPQMRDVVTVLAAGALPGLYFGLTARGPHGRTWPMALLPVLSKFSATVMISLALAAIGEAGEFGLLIAVPALAVALPIGIGTSLLRRGWLLGVLPLLTYVALGVICLRWHFSLDFDNTAIHGVGAAALAVACAAAILAVAELRLRHPDRAVPATGGS
jgi:hypothetical protein